VKTFVLGVLVAVLVFVAYPKRHAIFCLMTPEHEQCLPKLVEPAVEPVVEPVIEEVPKQQKVYKWVDAKGVVHYGEREHGGALRIDESLTELSVVSGGQKAKLRNQGAARALNATGNSRSITYSQNSSSAFSKKSQREEKKRRCAYLAGKRDGYSMKTSGYKRYSTQYGQECIF